MKGISQAEPGRGLPRVDSDGRLVTAGGIRELALLLECVAEVDVGLSQARIQAQGFAQARFRLVKAALLEKDLPQVVQGPGVPRLDRQRLPVMRLCLGPTLLDHAHIAAPDE